MIPSDDTLDLMVDVLDLIGRLDYVRLVTVAALAHRMLPPSRRGMASMSRRREHQAARLQGHAEQVRRIDDDAYRRLAELLEGF